MALKRICHHATNYRLFSTLTFGLQEVTIKVRVLRQWDDMSYRSLDEMAAHFILLDEEDNQILAYAQPQERARLLRELHEGIVYNITYFKIVVVPIKWKPIATEKAVLFTKQTKVRPCFDKCPIAKVKFVLCPFPGIASRLGDNTALIDVSGIVFRVGNITHNNHGVQKLIIQLIDESGSVVAISLWGTKATQFDMKFGKYRQKNVLLVVTGLLPKCNDGRIMLASTSATKSYFNPAYEKLEAIGKIVASKYGEFICQLSSTEAYENLYPIGVQKIYLTLQQTKEPSAWVRPQLLAKQVFLSKVTIKDILLSQNCHSRPTNIDDPVQLAESLNTVILVADSTGTAEFIMKNPELEQLTGIPIEQLITHSAEKHVKQGKSLPVQLNCITDTLCTFEIERPNSADTSKVGQILIKSIVESMKLVQKRKPINYLLQHVDKKPCQAVHH